MEHSVSRRRWLTGAAALAAVGVTGVGLSGCTTIGDGLLDSYGNPTIPTAGRERHAFDALFLAGQATRERVAFSGRERPGTIIIDTRARTLHLVEPRNMAIRYRVGVGREGFQWAGSHAITRKAEWPDWTPPPQMLRRRPDLPRFMRGGPSNPMGARGLYLGSTLFRIHGSNEPETIGHAVSSGCIRMHNADVIDLYERVRVGQMVIVRRA